MFNLPLTTSALSSLIPRLLIVVATPDTVLFGALGTAMLADQSNKLLVVVIVNVCPAVKIGLDTVPKIAGTELDHSVVPNFTQTLL
jgi:hypothetical protein